MTFQELREEIARLAHVHPLACTNVEAVSIVGTDVQFETDTSELEDAKDSLEATEKELKEEQARCIDLEADVERLNASLLEVKDPESGMTAKDFVAKVAELTKETGEAKDLALAAQRQAHQCEIEMKALRKKKGITCGIVKHAQDVRLLLYYIRDAKPENFSRYQQSCRDMLAKLDAS